MEIDKLIESFSAISELLSTPNLQNQIKQDNVLAQKTEEIQTLVERIRFQHGEFSVSNDDLLLTLETLNHKISDLAQYCDVNLIKLDFLDQLKPFT